MLARSSTAGLLAAMAISLSGDAPYFTLQSTGALELAVASDEARYGISPEPYHGRPVIAISLGATQGDAALLLYTYADEPVRPGRYPVAMDLPQEAFAGRRFHPCFVAGTVEHPQGFFHGESGWVTITAVEFGRIAGEFEIQARGFHAADTSNEDQWVTLRGSFGAQADSTVAGVQTASSATR
jgi:hypothetical protein